MSPAAPERLETERLLCERLTAEHGPELAALLSDPQVYPTLSPTGKPPTESELDDNLAQKLDHWRRLGFGLWLLRDRISGAMVGRGGLQYTFLRGLHEVEVGWAIVPERWGEGFATELAQASVKVAFEDLRLPEIIAFTLPTNLASLRVMEKAGFSFDSEVVHVGLAHLLYRRRPSASLRPRCYAS